MAKHIILGMLILQIYVNAAPSDVSKLENIAEVTQDEPQQDNPTLLDDTSDSTTPQQGTRQKRFYNYYGYGFPPISPLIYPGYNKRDQSSDTGLYGADDPLQQIHKRLQDIASAVRQPSPPPLPPQFPIFFPVIFIPQADCACNPEDGKPQNPNDNKNNQTVPDVANRWPVMDDERQNWGLVVNESDTDISEDDDFSRPISFDPIRPSNSGNRPPPPVDHGSNQGDTQTPSTTAAPARAPVQPKADPTPYPESFAPGSSGTTNSQAPNTCDGAVLSCCHQLTVTYDCFAAQGCPDPSSYGNPCNPLVILRVISRFQNYYSQKNG